MENNDQNELKEMIKLFAAEKRTISVPVVQKTFGVDYLTARKFIDELELEKIIKRAEGVDYICIVDTGAPQSTAKKEQDVGTMHECQRALTEFFFTESKSAFLARLMMLEYFVENKFPRLKEFYDEFTECLSAIDEEGLDAECKFFCESKTEEYCYHADSIKKNENADEILYDVHECLIELLAQNQEKERMMLLCRAYNEYEGCDDDDKRERMVRRLVADEIAQINKETLQLLKAETLRLACDGVPHIVVDIAYVIDGSNDGALFEYAGKVMEEMESKLWRHCHSALGDMSASLRERLICFGNSATDGSDTVTQSRFFTMPYGKAAFRVAFADDVHKKKNTQNRANGLEGLWAAMHSDWTYVVDEDKCLQLIVVLSGGGACAPDGEAAAGEYPRTMSEYEKVWRGKTDKPVLSQSGKRLFIFAPSDGAENWKKIAKWDKVCFLADAYENLKPSDVADYIVLACLDLFSGG